MQINKKFLFAGIILFIFCILSYGNSINNAFLLDDKDLILKEGAIKDVSSPEEFFITGFNKFYRPVSFSVLYFVYNIFQLNTHAYHILNIFLFFVICFLFFIILQLCFKDFNISFISSCLFCLHPINNVYVNLKIGLLLIVYIIFVQLSVIFFLLYLDKGKIYLKILSLTCFLLSIFSHEMSFMVPIYLFIIMYFLKNITLKANVLNCLSYLVPFIIYLIARNNLVNLRPINTIFYLNISLGIYFATINKLICWYLNKLISAHNILFLWDVILDTKGLVILNLSFLILLLISFYLIFFKWKKGINAFSLSLFMVGFIPSGLSAFTYSPITKTAFIEPHWFCFSSIGFFVLISNFLIFITNKINKRIKIFALIIFILSLAVITRQSNIVWKDEKIYCMYWLGLNPLNKTPWDKMIAYIKNNNNVDENEKIINNLENYVRNNPSYLSYIHMANMYSQIQNHDSAIRSLNIALKLNPEYKLTYNDRGVIYGKKEMYVLALMDFNELLKYEPNYALGYYNRSLTYFALGKIKLALDDAIKAQSLGYNVDEEYIDELKKVK